MNDVVTLDMIPTVESIRARRVLEDADLAEREKARRAADKVIAGWPLANGMMALTQTGRLFFRSLDSRNFDGRNPEKFVWREIEGPLE